ncbi:MAG: M28 family peptidase, partial [Planctomycetota bacterium]|nr:M28 family peptidase [Planctomycetota bacterium]
MRPWPLALVLAASACSSIATDQAPSGDSPLDAATLRAHMRFLADDLLEGRGPGTRADELSQLYLATQLEGLGFEPGAADGGWIQPVPIVGITSKVAETLTAIGSDGTRVTFEGPTDFTAQAAQVSDEVAWASAPLVFVGYGISAPEQDWDDFKDVDVAGKVLLVMNNDPESDPELFAGKRRLYYGRWSYKFEEAARRGAAGVLVIHTTPSAGYPFQVIQAGHERERFFLPPSDTSPARLPIQGWCSEDAARRLAGLGGQDLDALRARAESRDFRPVELTARVGLRLENEIREIDTANVVGVLPGSDPALAEEAVVVTAHYDHIGIGPAKGSDSIYNGAVDNASGTAGVLT